MGKKFTQLPERKNKVYAVSRCIIIIHKSSKLLHRMKTEQGATMKNARASNEKLLARQQKGKSNFGKDGLIPY